MASNECRPVEDVEIELDLDLISVEEMNNCCDFGNEQTWLCWPTGSNPNSYVDLSEFLQVKSSIDDKERLYRTVLELETTKGGGIDTRTFTRPKKTSPYRPLQRVLEPVCHTSFQPRGEANSKYRIFSNPPLRKDVSRLKDLTNSSFEAIYKIPQTPHKIPNLDDWNITEQSMLSEISSPSFLSISDSDDGMSENNPSVSINVNNSELKPKRGKSAERKLIPQTISSFEPSSMSTPSIRARNNFGGLSVEAPLQFNSTEVLSTCSTMNSDSGETSSLDRGLSFSPDQSLCIDLLARKLNDSRVSNSYTDLCDADERPKSSPRQRSGLQRLSHNNTFRLLKNDEPQHFKSVESGLNSTFQIVHDSHENISNNGVQANQTTSSSTGNLRRSVGDVHQAAQQQEYELRHCSIDAKTSFGASALKSHMKKVMSETRLFPPNDERKLMSIPNHHSSVTNLPFNNNQDNGNIGKGHTNFPTLLLSPKTKKLTENVGCEVKELVKPVAPGKTRSRIPSRLPTRLPRLQASSAKMAQDWSKGCS